MDGLVQFFGYSGFANATPGHLLMILVGMVFIYLAIRYEYQPILLVPIGFGILIEFRLLVVGFVAGQGDLLQKARERRL